MNENLKERRSYSITRALHYPVTSNRALAMVEMAPPPERSHAHLQANSNSCEVGANGGLPD